MILPEYVIRFCILVFGSFGFLVIIMTIIQRGIYLREKKWRLQTRISITKPLASFLNGIEEDKALNAISELVITPKQRQILLIKLILARQSFSGKYSEKALWLYYHFKLDVDSLKKINSKIWHRIIEGIVELSIMDKYQIKYRFIALAKHSNVNVRRNAKIALIRLEKANGLKDLFEINDTLSNWSYISILSILRREPFKINVNQLKQYVDNDDKNTVQLFDHLQKHTVIY